MIKVLFVCHGNICRSPMAEYILKNKLSKRKLKDLFIVESKAMSSEELGNPIYYKTKEILNAKGIYDINHKARKIQIEDYETFDYIFVMDNYNMNYVPHKYLNKVQKLGNFISEGLDIDDPWYTRNFELTYNLIDKAIELFLESLNI